MVVWLCLLMLIKIYWLAPTAITIQLYTCGCLVLSLQHKGFFHFEWVLVYSKCFLSGFYIQSNAYHFHTVFGVFKRKSHLIEFGSIEWQWVLVKLIFFVNVFGINVSNGSPNIGGRKHIYWNITHTQTIYSIWCSFIVNIGESWFENIHGMTKTVRFFFKPSNRINPNYIVQ